VLKDRRDDGFLLSDDASLLNHDLVHRWISTDTYWAAGRTRDTMDRAIAGSYTVGVYREDDLQQVAFARIVTDGAVFAYLCDVYVDPDLRGRGLGRWVVSSLRDDLAARGLKRLLLATNTAQGVYAPLGFEHVAAERWMSCDLERHREGPAPR